MVNELSYDFGMLNDLQVTFGLLIDIDILPTIPIARYSKTYYIGSQWRSGSVLDLRSEGPRFDPISRAPGLGKQN